MVRTDLAIALLALKETETRILKDKIAFLERQNRLLLEENDALLAELTLQKEPEKPVGFKTPKK
jgi:hypothetical protein